MEKRSENPAEHSAPAHFLVLVRLLQVAADLLHRREKERLPRDEVPEQPARDNGRHHRRVLHPLAAEVAARLAHAPAGSPAVVAQRTQRPMVPLQARAGGLVAAPVDGAPMDDDLVGVAFRARGPQALVVALRHPEPLLQDELAAPSAHRPEAHLALDTLPERVLRRSHGER
eukprot:1394706-Rhodomonas_salina.2